MTQTSRSERRAAKARAIVDDYLSSCRTSRSIKPTQLMTGCERAMAETCTSSERHLLAKATYDILIAELASGHWRD